MGRRHEFPLKTMREALKRSGGRCEAMGAVYGLDPGRRCNAAFDGKRPEYDHYPLPAGDEGSDTLDNCVTCCTVCHGHKTATYDIPMQAKGKRVSDRHFGIRKPSSFQSKGFAPAKPQRKASSPVVGKFDGDIMSNTLRRDPV